MQAMHGA